MKSEIEYRMAQVAVERARAVVGKSGRNPDNPSYSSRNCDMMGESRRTVNESAKPFTLHVTMLRH